MDINNPKKTFTVGSLQNLYSWAKFWNRKQRRFFVGEIKLRREKQIEDFIFLNGFTRVHFLLDTDLFAEFDKAQWVDVDPDLVVITDQKFSRRSCPDIIIQIQQTLQACPNLYLCLNRHYINIDNSFHDLSLDQNFNLAITQWLKKNLPQCDVLDLGLDYLDCGQHFTWAVPDRHYFIQRRAKHN